MTRVFSKALDQTIEVERLIGHIKGSEEGPTLIFTGGIHGNEPSGVFALKRVMDKLKSDDIPIKGNIYALAGNLWALENGDRFRMQDLNRLWDVERMERFNEWSLNPANEDVAQQVDINNQLRQIMDRDKGPFYFMDLHTTSSETVPFLTVNDSLLNRKFTEQYPVPMILGIEEYLDGPLLSYINELGYVAFGFEAGQHDDLASIENNEAFIYLSLVFTGCVEKDAIDFTHYYHVLGKNTIDTRDIFEIYFRYAIGQDEKFEMKPGYLNFQKVHKGETVANSNGSDVKASNNGRIFMPLYQSQGSDGFFAIRKIPAIFLRISSVMRKARFDRVLTLLPGIHWISQKGETLLVNRRIARFFTKQLFHLMGYRSQRLDKEHFVMKNREAASRKADYIGADWF